MFLGLALWSVVIGNFLDTLTRSLPEIASLRDNSVRVVEKTSKNNYIRTKKSDRTF